MGSGVVASCILNFVTRWKWVVSFATRPLYLPRKNRRFPSDRKLYVPQNWSGRGAEEKKYPPLPGIQPLSCIKIKVQKTLISLRSQLKGVKYIDGFWEEVCKNIWIWCTGENCIMSFIVCTFHMRRACSTHGRDEKWIQNFSWKAWREETTWETWA
jgi:hypothetical protein